MKSETRWESKELFHEDLLSEDACEVWKLVPNMKTTQFHLVNMYGEDGNDMLPGGWENMSADHRAHIIRMYAYLSRMYKMIAENAKPPSFICCVV